MSIIYIIILIILIIYIYSFYNYPKKVYVMQTNLDKLNYSMLLERQPVVIENTKTDLEKLQQNLFVYMIPTYFSLDSSENWYNNIYKHLIFQAITEDPEKECEILIYPPYKKLINNVPDTNEKLLNIQLKNGQCLILPLHWKYYIEKRNKFNCLGINNIITYILPS